jgi:predicted ATPase
MFVSQMRIVDYKSLLDSGKFELDTHLTVVVGQNNVGKSALLEMMNFASGLPTNLHRSPKAPKSPDRKSETKLRLVARREEVAELVERAGGVWIPFPRDASHVQPYIDLFFNRNEFAYEFTCNAANIDGPPYPSLAVEGASYKRTSVRVTSSNGNFVYAGAQDHNGGDEIPLRLFDYWKKRVFVFRAERLNVGRSGAGDETLLNSNASNLPVILARLQEDRHAMDEYLDALRSIIPGIAHISVGHRSGGLTIQVLPDYRKDRESFALALEECGSGLGQVLAILYVVMQMDGGLVVVDEPNSFLHPGAAKQLIRIMRQHRRNQYIISTHSPEVIVASSPCRIVLVKREKMASTALAFSSGEVSQLRDTLEEIGSSLSDVFGIEKIIWVEGETERDAFPILLEKSGVILPPGVAFAPMRTSDLGGKRRIAQVIADLHTRLANVSALMPTSSAFAFDGELRSAEDRARISEVLRGKERFLPRRMLENYLFHAEAVLNTIKKESLDVKVGVEEVSRRLAEAQANVEEVDGYRVLKSIFWDFGTVDYVKTRDSVRLVEEILTLQPEFLEELQQFVKLLLSEAK